VTPEDVRPEADLVVGGTNCMSPVPKLDPKVDLVEIDLRFLCYHRCLLNFPIQAASLQKN
jgi:hypothetical protein